MATAPSPRENIPYLKHEVKREGLGERVLGGRLSIVLVQNFAELLGAVGIRQPLHAEVLLALRLTIKRHDRLKLKLQTPHMQIQSRTPQT